MIGPPVAQEEFFNRGTRVEASRESRNDPHAARFHRRDNAIIVAGVAREHIGAHHEKPDGPRCAALGRGKCVRRSRRCVR